MIDMHFFNLLFFRAEMFVDKFKFGFDFSSEGVVFSYEDNEMETISTIETGVNIWLGMASVHLGFRRLPIKREG